MLMEAKTSADGISEPYWQVVNEGKHAGYAARFHVMFPQPFDPLGLPRFPGQASTAEIVWGIFRDHPQDWLVVPFCELFRSKLYGIILGLVIRIHVQRVDERLLQQARVL